MSSILRIAGAIATACIGAAASAYRPDGSIQDFSETTDYQPAP